MSDYWKDARAHKKRVRSHQRAKETIGGGTPKEPGVKNTSEKHGAGGQAKTLKSLARPKGLEPLTS